MEKIIHSANAPITFLTTLSERENGDRDDLLFICQDGEIQCLDGIDLKTRWISPASTISKNTSMPDVINHRVHFAQLTDVHTASKRLLKGREDILSVFPQEIQDGAFNPQILIIITSPKDPALASDRTLHVVTLPLKMASDSTGSIRSVHALLSIALPRLHSEITGEVEYNLQVASGVLHELDGLYLRALDLSGSRPKIQSQLYVKDVKSFLPLSRTSILTASKESINIYNRTFQSIQAFVSLNSNLQFTSRKRKIDDEDLTSTPKTCKLVAYSPKYNIAHAIAGNDLIAFQIDSRQDAPGRRHAFGLLIDTLGCGIAPALNPTNEPLQKLTLKSLGSYIPGSDPNLEKGLGEKFSELDRFVVEEDVAAFERFMANELGIQRQEGEESRWKEEQKMKKANRISVTPNGLNGHSTKPATGDAMPVPQWMWPESREDYAAVDPRLVQYILSRIFSWRSSVSSKPAESTETLDNDKLVITFFPSNVVHWLIETGNLSPANVRSALRRDGQISITERIPAGQIIAALADVDPELKLLFSFMSSTHLDAMELLHAIRLLMQSLELLEDASKAENHLLTNGETLESTNGELEAEIELEQEKAATALSIAESYLGDSSSIRGQALSLALAKLYACPGSAVVSALRSMLTSAEIVSLIYLLRFELARGAWTSRYLDTYEGDNAGDEQGQENTILLVSGLLNCCIDAIGAGGWLSGDSTLVNGDHFESEELIQSLKLEVSAALEGIEEAAYLKGLIAEMVRYGEGVQKGLPARETGRKMDRSGKREARPITLPQVGRDSRLLPFGLKGEQQVSLYRVGAGGEIQHRTARDIGRLKSKKVGKYSRERIVI